MRMTNKQLINKLSKDAIDQVFLVSAIEHYSKQVIENNGEGWSANSFINYDLWKICAEHALKTIKERTV